jgi:hypothetical protein
MKDEPEKFDAILSKDNLIDVLCKKPITFRHTITGTVRFIRVDNAIVAMTLSTYESSTTLEQVINDIMRTVDKKESEKSMKILYSVTHNDKTEHINTMYSGRIVPVDELERTFIDTMFHKDIKELWQRVKDIHFHPEKMWGMGIAPRMNLLLHGPPGTGKSTFAYRIAMATGRHIINVELCHYTKDELIDLFRAPKVNGVVMKPSEVVFVLDEFDNDIKNIMFKTECKQTQLKKIDGFMDRFFNESIQDSEPVPVPTQEQTQDEGKKPVVAQTSKIDQIDKYLKSITDTYDKINSIGTQIVRIEDLLTIFQGSVPIVGCIIIAMTNHYDDLVKQCPALFRRGRLTPVEFGLFDMHMLNKVSSHYFGKGLVYDMTNNVDISVPPSHIMEIISDSMLKENKKYDFFVEKVNEFLVNKVSKVMGVEKELVPSTIVINPSSSITLGKNQYVIYTHKDSNGIWLCNQYNMGATDLFGIVINKGPMSHCGCGMGGLLDSKRYELVSSVCQEQNASNVCSLYKTVIRLK